MTTPLPTERTADAHSGPTLGLAVDISDEGAVDAAMSADIPLGRVGTVDDVAALLTFLMGEDAGYITAATYDVNGGLQIS